MKETTDKLNFTKIKNPCPPKDTDKRTKEKPRMRERILAKDTSGKELIQNIQSTLKIQ